MVVPLGTTLKHVQVREYVRALVQDLPEGAPAPSERGLMQHFGGARMTVRQAIDALVAEGLLERAPARGTFVCKNPRPVSRPLSFTEDARARGWTTTTETLQSGLGQAGPGVAKALGITIEELLPSFEEVFPATQVTTSSASPITDKSMRSAVDLVRTIQERGALEYAAQSAELSKRSQSGRS